MNNLLTHYPVNWIDGMKLSSRTHSYYTRHELQARASGGQRELWIMNYEFWIGVRGVQAIVRAMRAMGVMGWMTVAKGIMNFEFSILNWAQAAGILNSELSTSCKLAPAGEVIDKEWATRSYYSRHELQARASRTLRKGMKIEKNILIQ